MIRSVRMPVLLAIVLAAGAATAQTKAGGPNDPDTRGVGSVSKDAARKAFRAGIKAFDEKAYAEALTKFLAAHRLSGSYTALFNIGHSYAALGRPVEAADALEKYLSEGAAEIKPDRKADVEQLIAHQEERIGTIVVRGVGATVDGVWVAPDQPLRVTAARHTVVAVTGAIDPSERTKQVEVAAKATTEVRFAPPAAETPATPVVVPAPPAEPSAQVAPIDTPKAPATEAAQPSVAAGDGAAAIDDRSGARLQRTAGFVTVGAGVVGVVVGAIVAASAAGRASDAKQAAGSSTNGAAWDAAKADYDGAKSTNTTGWGVIGIGSAAIVTGAVLLLTAPRTETTSAHITFAPWATADGRGVVAQGAW
jgi:tetratricopeptide (TPR) repeat protein